MTVSIKPIKPKRISDQVFDQIRELIFRGTLKPGEKMMPERELAEAMNVSRTTIRDAIQRLVTMGLIVQKQGQGTFVKTHDGKIESPLVKAMEAQDATIEELLEVRMGLECNATALAAKRADENDLKALAHSIEEMKIEIASGRLGTEADTSFHMAIAYAAKNPLQVLVMRNFYDYLFYGIRENLSGLYEKEDNIQIIIRQHEEIMKTIKNRDPYGAYKAMKNHIQFVMDFFGDKKTF
ncbi:transcriptional regulator, GntR family [Desulfocicer vacuolatum DSM 3385]|uniref:Transcriptional regulator, GntR family n=1 Tax=Desulfocicer vacuolatum DSM 3385 TaxID=1121400 RepID=A0A1W2CLK6_9BACT|nr:FadR/GntR family transcriptional regulator [Desulfocicer vacuolatum]SMC86080.1 transcriptional regulator, GntR family [Desulfocicer vacuolatum DSM 3385]